MGAFRFFVGGGLLALGPALVIEASPQPGEVYREYIISNDGNDWRVTNPTATDPGALAFLPNPILRTDPISLAGAVRAEAVLDAWDGHVRTIDRRLRFNGNDWLDVPRPLGADGAALSSFYYTQHNPEIPVPLEYLRSGENTVEGICGSERLGGWGQWGMYAVVLRVYYDPAVVTAPVGHIISPVRGGILRENPTVALAAASPQGISRVDVFAWYDGYDENGDGVGLDWHEALFAGSLGAEPVPSGHVGTVREAPYNLVWDTNWVPDQAEGGVRLVARIQDQSGLWMVTPIVDELSLVREEFSVRLFGVEALPPAFGVRAGSLIARLSNIPLPEAEELEGVIEAGLHYRTWNGWDGFHEPFRLNNHLHDNEGRNHFYDHDLIPIPVGELNAGDNAFGIRSDYTGHALEVLTPGPALVIRFRKISSATRLINLSGRARLTAGEGNLIVGVVFEGGGTRSVLVRGIGPGLTEFGVAGALSDPSLHLRQATTSIADNLNWEESGEVETISSATSRLGAFPLVTQPKDAAIHVPLAAGVFTAQIQSADASAGIALAEIYDAGAESARGEALRMINLSMRAPVEGGDGTLIAGFVISGTTPLRVLLRGFGPSLIPFGVVNAVGDPRLVLFGPDGEIATNEDWAGAADVRAASELVGAFTLTSDRDAAILVTLPPGPYSLHIQAEPGDEGVALVEIYELPGS